jgi:hypothetical protein
VDLEPDPAVPGICDIATVLVSEDEVGAAESSMMVVVPVTVYFPAAA